MKPTDLSTRRLGVLLVAVLLVVSVGVGAIAISFDAPVQGSVPVAAPDGPEVTLEGSTDAALSSPIPDSNTVNWTTAAGNATFSSNGLTEATVAVEDLEGTWTNVTSIGATSADLTITPGDKPAVTVGGQVTDVAWRGDTSLDDDTAAVSYSANGSGSITLRGFAASTDWTAATPTGDVVDAGTTTSSGTATISVSAATNEDLVLFTAHAPSIDDASASPNNRVVNSSTFDLAVDVSDPDFDIGDEVNVSFYVDGEYRGSDTGIANGTYDIEIADITGGQHDWSVVATSTKPSGESTSSGSFSFSYPSELEIRNETGNHELLDLNTEVEVTFYTDNEIVTREAENGVVSLIDLPTNQEFVVTIDADGWHARRIILDSLTSQNTVYLLNESEPAVYNEFQLRDLTGNFPRESTRLYVKRGMNVSGESGYYTIAGDYLGATGSFPVQLLQGARYKIVLETTSGRQTTVGAYLAESEGVKTVRVGTVEFEYPDDDSYYAVAREENNTLHWKFSDPQGKTSDLSLQIYERGDESNVIYEDTVNELGNYTLAVDLEGVTSVANATDKQWAIKWSATRDGGAISATSPFMPIQAYPIPLGGVWKAGLSFLMVLFVAALGGGRYSPEGAIATVAIAGILMGTGFADLYGFAWWAAFVIAIGGYVYDRGIPL